MGGPPALSLEVARPGVSCSEELAFSRASVSLQTLRATELVLSAEQASLAIRVRQRVQINWRPQDREQAPNKDPLPNRARSEPAASIPRPAGPYSSVPRLFASLSGSPCELGGQWALIDLFLGSPRCGQ